MSVACRTRHIRLYYYDDYLAAAGAYGDHHRSRLTDSNPDPNQHMNPLGKKVYIRRGTHWRLDNHFHLYLRE